MTRVNFAPTAPAPIFNMDAGDGYAAARDRLLGFVGARAIDNVVVISGDIHSSWVADLRAAFDVPGSPVVATELVGTAISSTFSPGRGDGGRGAENGCSVNNRAFMRSTL